MRPERFQVTLRRRLRLPLPLAPGNNSNASEPEKLGPRFSCGAALDLWGNHRAACPTSGLLRLRAGPVEKAWGQVLREAGGRVLDNLPLRCMGLERRQPRGDRRAVELVVRDLQLYHGMPLACDATVASPLHRDGTARPGAASHPGTAIAAREADKANTYPELVTSQRVRVVVVLAGEVGGR